jgi:hypothetical protein
MDRSGEVRRLWLERLALSEWATYSDTIPIAGLPANQVKTGGHPPKVGLRLQMECQIKNSFTAFTVALVAASLYPTWVPRSIHGSLFMSYGLPVLLFRITPSFPSLSLQLRELVASGR